MPRGHGERQPSVGRIQARRKQGEKQHRLTAGVTPREAGSGPALLCAAVPSEHLPFPGIFGLFFSLSPEPVLSLAVVNHFGWGWELYLHFCP